MKCNHRVHALLLAAAVLLIAAKPTLESKFPAMAHLRCLPNHTLRLSSDDERVMEFSDAGRCDIGELKYVQSAFCEHVLHGHYWDSTKVHVQPCQPWPAPFTITANPALVAPSTYTPAIGHCIPSSEDIDYDDEFTCHLCQLRKIVHHKAAVTKTIEGSTREEFVEPKP